MRYDQADQERIRGELVRVRRRAYEDELGIQAGRAGCPGRTGRLTVGPALAELNQMSQADAESIVATYNWDLASAIEAIRAENPRANRNVYAKRLGEWDLARTRWKAAQIAEYSEGTARSKAQADFVRLNGLDGTARLGPPPYKCPICQGFARRGSVPLQEALDSPGPFHPNCPHIWTTRYTNKPKRGECGELWVGE